MLVFLHEGLGCIEMWRDFPQKLCDATACAGIVYDRTSYGGSSPWPTDPGLRYMEIEADEVLPVAGRPRHRDACVRAQRRRYVALNTPPAILRRCAPW